MILLNITPDLISHYAVLWYQCDMIKTLIIALSIVLIVISLIHISKHNDKLGLLFPISLFIATFTFMIASIASPYDVVDTSHFSKPYYTMETLHKKSPSTVAKWSEHNQQLIKHNNHKYKYLEFHSKHYKLYLRHLSRHDVIKPRWWMWL